MRSELQQLENKADSISGTIEQLEIESKKILSQIEALDALAHNLKNIKGDDSNE